MVKTGRSTVHFSDPTNGFPQESYNLHDAIVSLINSARDSIHLVSYSLPVYNQGWYLHDVIESAMQRNVKLKVHGNNYTEVSRLISRHRQRGAEGWHWVMEGDSDIFHIKAIMVDGIKLYLGSANLSQNSIHNSAEWGMVTESPDICLQLEKYLEYLQDADRFRSV